MTKILIDSEKCSMCLTCYSNCPVLLYEEDGNEVSVKQVDLCIHCFVCEDSCPENAILVIT